MCESSTNAIPVSLGRCSISCVKAASPPADAPIATTRGWSISLMAASHAIFVPFSKRAAGTLGASRSPGTRALTLNQHRPTETTRDQHPADQTRDASRLLEDGQFAVVDHIEGQDSIKLKKDNLGKHHFIPLSWVTVVDSKVHVDRPGTQAMQEWRT